MLKLDEAEIQGWMLESSDLRSIHTQINHAKAQLEQSHQALAGMPRIVRDSLLIEQQTALHQLIERGERTKAQAREWAIRKIKEAYVETLQAEAKPLLEKAEKAIETARTNLLKVADIEYDARPSNGSIMTERFGKESVDFFLPVLTFEADRGTWKIKRR
jgi:hypothetical protein